MEHCGLLRAMIYHNKNRNYRNAFKSGLLATWHTANSFPTRNLLLLSLLEAPLARCREFLSLCSNYPSDFLLLPSVPAVSTPYPRWTALRLLEDCNHSNRLPLFGTDVKGSSQERIQGLLSQIGSATHMSYTGLLTKAAAKWSITPIPITLSYKV